MDHGCGCHFCQKLERLLGAESLLESQRCKNLKNHKKCDLDSEEFFKNTFDILLFSGLWYCRGVTLSTSRVMRSSPLGLDPPICASGQTNGWSSAIHTFLGLCANQYMSRGSIRLLLLERATYLWYGTTFTFAYPKPHGTLRDKSFWSRCIYRSSNTWCSSNV